MPLKKSDLDDALLAASAEVREFMTEFEQEWNQGEEEKMKKLFWRMLDPAVKEQLKLQAPEAAADMEKRYGNGKD